MILVLNPIVYLQGCYGLSTSHSVRISFSFMSSFLNNWLQNFLRLIVFGVTGEVTGHMFLFPSSRTLSWELRRCPESLFPPQFKILVVPNEESFFYLRYLCMFYTYTCFLFCFRGG